MFFDITTQIDTRFTDNIAVGDFVINVDDGWKQTTIAGHNIIYKGYCDTGVLDHMLPQIMQQTDPVITGNFCVLDHDPAAGTLTVRTDRYRAFPLYYESGQSVTNLRPRSNTAWTDHVLTIHRDLSCHEHKFDVIGSTQLVPSTIDSIHQYLMAKIERFLCHNHLPVRVFLSGGVDTTLLYSCVRALGARHEMIWCSHVDHDYFYLGNHNDIQQHWAYRQIHHWTQPCVLMSGAPGDEFTLRSPTTANLWLLDQGSHIPEQLAQQPQCLHHSYFSLPKHVSVFQQQIDDFAPVDDMVWHLCNINVNDWQHWHLGNTLTWTPLRDLELFKMFLGLPRDVLLEQIMSSQVSIDLIEKNVPGLSGIISDQKNTGNSLSNLRRLIS